MQKYPMAIVELILLLLTNPNNNLFIIEHARNKKLVVNIKSVLIEINGIDSKFDDSDKVFNTIIGETKKQRNCKKMVGFIFDIF